MRFYGFQIVADNGDIAYICAKCRTDAIEIYCIEKGCSKEYVKKHCVIRHFVEGNKMLKDNDMPRYIDAEKLIQRLEREVESCKDPNRGSALGFKMAIFIAQTLADEQVVPRAEVAREIFAEISEIVTAIYNKHIFKSDLEDEEKEAVMDFEVDISSAFDELEEKYTEVKTDE